jgi:colanic acid/amylovoran biosynthesis glycosyltransferase
MRIAVVPSKFPEISEAFVVNHIIGLLDAGHEVDILARSSSPGEAAHMDVQRYGLLDRTYYLPPKQAENAVARKIQNALYRLKIFRHWPKRADLLVPVRWGGSPVSWDVRYTLSHVAKKRYDVIHCHFGPVGLQYLFLKEFFPTLPFVVNFHGYDAYRHPKTTSPNVYHELFHNADAIIANSRSTRRQLQKLGCPLEKIHLIPVSLNSRLFPFQKKTLNGKNVLLLTVARLVEKKGLLYSIRAAAKVMAAQPRLEYNIVGEGPLRGELEKEIDRLGKRGRINLVGAKTQEEVSNFYRRSHIFVLASVTAADGDSEGQGLVLQEAQACGLPVLATRHNGFAEGLVEGKSGFLVPERDVDALAKRLSYLTNHPECWTSMGYAGRKFVEERYDKDVIAQQLSNLYHRLIHERES